MMKIKTILSALLLMASSLASAQYLNVKLPDGTYHSYKTTPDMKVSFGEKAGADVTESGQIVTVNGHQVTVKLADDVLADDVLLHVYVEDGTLKIKAASAEGYGLDCSRDDNGVVSEPAVSNGFFTFTISNIQKDVVVTIGYITVKFDMKGHGEAIKEAIVKYGKTVQAPPTPTAANHVFWCWCTDADCTTQYDFSKGVTSDMTLYAKWTGGINGHAYVELAGYKWATENVGYCNNVTAFAGPNKPRNDWKFYFYDQSNASGAAQSWGSETDASQVTHSWELPSEKQWQALIDSCYWERTKSYNYLNSPYNGKPGYIVYKAKSDAEKNSSTKKTVAIHPLLILTFSFLLLVFATPRKAMSTTRATTVTIGLQTSRGVSTSTVATVTCTAAVRTVAWQCVLSQNDCANESRATSLLDGYAECSQSKTKLIAARSAYSIHLINSIHVFRAIERLGTHPTKKKISRSELKTFNL